MLEIDRDRLTGDMYALAAYMMRSANVGTFNAIAELDLSFTQIKALCALEIDGQERSVKALADSLGVSLPAMSRAVDGLFERGLVGREEDKADRRMKRVRLTESGPPGSPGPQRGPPLRPSGADRLADRPPRPTRSEAPSD